MARQVFDLCGIRTAQENTYAKTFAWYQKIFESKREDPQHRSSLLIMPDIRKSYFTSISSMVKFSSFPAISWFASNVIVVSVLSVTLTGNGWPYLFCR